MRLSGKKLKNEELRKEDEKYAQEETKQVASHTKQLSALETKLNAELEDKLTQGLPINGAPVIQEIIPMPSPRVRGWTASYTRAVAIKITMASPIGTVALLKLDGTPLKTYQWPTVTMHVIAHAFTSGVTSKINPNVATLLALPANEAYLQT